MAERKLPAGQLSPYDYDDDPEKIAQMDREEQTVMPPLPPWPDEDDDDEDEPEDDSD